MHLNPSLDYFSLESWRAPRRRIWTKALAITVAITFVLPFVSFAFAPGSYPASLLSEFGYTPLRANGASIEIKPEWGRIASSFKGTSGRTLVYIEDLHCNYEVQSNIRAMLEQLMRKNRLSLAGVEGESTAVDVSKLASMPLDIVKQRVGQYFLQRGRITGPEYQAAVSSSPLVLQGIESEQLYAANKKTLLRFFNQKSQGYCEDLRHALEQLKRPLYSLDLARIDHEREAYDQENITLEKYVDFLLQEAGHQGVEIEPYKVVRLYAQEHKLPMNAVVDYERLLHEAEAMDRAIRQKLYTTDEQRKLDHNLFLVKIMENLLTISATEQDLDYFRRNPAEFKAGSLLRFLEETSYRYGQHPDLDSGIIKLDEYLKAAGEFYAVADQRSRAFVDNITRSMNQHKQNLAVLITGGYHSSFVERILRQQNISFITVKPRITRMDAENPYFALLRNEKTPLEQMLAQNENIFAPRSLFKNPLFGRYMDTLWEIELGRKLVMEDGLQGEDLQREFKKFRGQYARQNPNVNLELVAESSDPAKKVYVFKFAGDDKNTHVILRPNETTSYTTAVGAEKLQGENFMFQLVSGDEFEQNRAAILGQEAAARPGLKAFTEFVSRISGKKGFFGKLAITLEASSAQAGLRPGAIMGAIAGVVGFFGSVFRAAGKIGKIGPAFAAGAKWVLTVLNSKRRWVWGTIALSATAVLVLAFMHGQTLSIITYVYLAVILVSLRGATRRSPVKSLVSAVFPSKEDLIARAVAWAKDEYGFGANDIVSTSFEIILENILAYAKDNKEVAAFIDNQPVRLALLGMAYNSGLKPWVDGTPLEHVAAMARDYLEAENLAENIVNLNTKFEHLHVTGDSYLAQLILALKRNPSLTEFTFGEREALTLERTRPEFVSQKQIKAIQTLAAARGLAIRVHGFSTDLDAAPTETQAQNGSQKYRDFCTALGGKITESDDSKLEAIVEAEILALSQGDYAVQLFQNFDATLDPKVSVLPADLQEYAKARIRAAMEEAINQNQSHFDAVVYALAGRPELEQLAEALRDFESFRSTHFSETFFTGQDNRILEALQKNGLGLVLFNTNHQFKMAVYTTQAPAAEQDLQVLPVACRDVAALQKIISDARFAKLFPVYTTQLLCSISALINDGQNAGRILGQLATKHDESLQASEDIGLQAEIAEHLDDLSQFTESMAWQDIRSHVLGLWLRQAAIDNDTEADPAKLAENVFVSADVARIAGLLAELQGKAPDTEVIELADVIRALSPETQHSARARQGAVINVKAIRDNAISWQKAAFELRKAVINGFSKLGFKIMNGTVTFTKTAAERRVRHTIGNLKDGQKRLTSRKKFLDKKAAKHTLSPAELVELIEANNLLGKYAQAQNALAIILEKVQPQKKKGKKETDEKKFEVLFSDRMDDKTQGISEVSGNKIYMNVDLVPQLSQRRHGLKLMSGLMHEAGHILGLDDTPIGQVCAELLGKMMAGYDLDLRQVLVELAKEGQYALIDSDQAEVELAALANGGGIVITRATCTAMQAWFNAQGWTQVRFPAEVLDAAMTKDQCQQLLPATADAQAREVGSELLHRITTALAEQGLYSTQDVKYVFAAVLDGFSIESSIQVLAAQRAQDFKPEDMAAAMEAYEQTAGPIVSMDKLRAFVASVFPGDDLAFTQAARAYADRLLVHEQNAMADPNHTVALYLDLDKWVGPQTAGLPQALQHAVREDIRLAVERGMAANARGAMDSLIAKKLEPLGLDSLDKVAASLRDVREFAGKHFTEAIFAEHQERIVAGLHSLGQRLAHQLAGQNVISLHSSLAPPTAEQVQPILPKGADASALLQSITAQPNFQQAFPYYTSWLISAFAATNRLLNNPGQTMARLLASQARANARQGVLHAELLADLERLGQATETADWQDLAGYIFNQHIRRTMERKRIINPWLLMQDMQLIAELNVLAMELGMWRRKFSDATVPIANLQRIAAQPVVLPELTSLVLAKAEETQPQGEAKAEPGKVETGKVEATQPEAANAGDKTLEPKKQRIIQELRPYLVKVIRQRMAVDANPIARANSILDQITAESIAALPDAFSTAYERFSAYNQLIEAVNANFRLSPAMLAEFQGSPARQAMLAPWETAASQMQQRYDAAMAQISGLHSQLEQLPALSATAKKALAAARKLGATGKALTNLQSTLAMARATQAKMPGYTSTIEIIEKQATQLQTQLADELSSLESVITEAETALKAPAPASQPGKVAHEAQGQKPVVNDLQAAEQALEKANEAYALLHASGVAEDVFLREQADRARKLAESAEQRLSQLRVEFKQMFTANTLGNAGVEARLQPLKDQINELRNRQQQLEQEAVAAAEKIKQAEQAVQAAEIEVMESRLAQKHATAPAQAGKPAIASQPAKAAESIRPATTQLLGRLHNNPAAVERLRKFAAAAGDSGLTQARVLAKVEALIEKEPSLQGIIQDLVAEFRNQETEREIMLAAIMVLYAQGWTEQAKRNDGHDNDQMAAAYVAQFLQGMAADRPARDKFRKKLEASVANARADAFTPIQPAMTLDDLLAANAKGAAKEGKPGTGQSGYRGEETKRILIKAWTIFFTERPEILSSLPIVGLAADAARLAVEGLFHQIPANVMNQFFGQFRQLAYPAFTNSVEMLGQELAAWNAVLAGGEHAGRMQDGLATLAQLEKGEQVEIHVNGQAHIINHIQIIELTSQQAIAENDRELRRAGAFFRVDGNTGIIYVMPGTNVRRAAAHEFLEYVVAGNDHVIVAEMEKAANTIPNRKHNLVSELEETTGLAIQVRSSNMRVFRKEQACRSTAFISKNGMPVVRVAVGEHVTVTVPKGKQALLGSMNFFRCAPGVIQGIDAEGNMVLTLAHLEASNPVGQADRLQILVSQLRRDNIRDLKVFVQVDPDAMKPAPSNSGLPGTYYTFPKTTEALQEKLGSDVKVLGMEEKLPGDDVDPARAHVYATTDGMVLEHPNLAHVEPSVYTWAQTPNSATKDEIFQQVKAVQPEVAAAEDSANHAPLGPPLLYEPDNSVPGDTLAEKRQSSAKKVIRATHRADEAVGTEGYAQVANQQERPLTAKDSEPLRKMLNANLDGILKQLRRSVPKAAMPQVEADLRAMASGQIPMNVRTISTITGNSAVSEFDGRILNVILEEGMPADLENSTFAHEVAEAVLEHCRVNKAHAITNVMEQAQFPESLALMLQNIGKYDSAHLQNLIDDTQAEIDAIRTQTEVNAYVKSQQEKNAKKVRAAARAILKAREPFVKLANEVLRDIGNQSGNDVPRLMDRLVQTLQNLAAGANGINGLRKKLKDVHSLEFQDFINSILMEAILPVTGANRYPDQNLFTEAFALPEIIRTKARQANAGQGQRQLRIGSLGTFTGVDLLEMAQMVQRVLAEQGEQLGNWEIVLEGRDISQTALNTLKNTTLANLPSAFKVETKLTVLGKAEDQQAIANTAYDILLFRTAAEYLRPEVRRQVDQCLRADILLVDNDVNPPAGQYQNVFFNVYQSRRTDFGQIDVTPAEAATSPRGAALAGEIKKFADEPNYYRQQRGLQATHAAPLAQQAAYKRFSRAVWVLIFGGLIGIVLGILASQWAAIQSSLKPTRQLGQKANVVQVEAGSKPVLNTAPALPARLTNMVDQAMAGYEQAFVNYPADKATYSKDQFQKMLVECLGAYRDANPSVFARNMQYVDEVRFATSYMGRNVSYATTFHQDGKSVMVINLEYYNPAELAQGIGAVIRNDLGHEPSAAELWAGVAVDLKYSVAHESVHAYQARAGVWAGDQLPGKDEVLVGISTNQRVARDTLDPIAARGRVEAEAILVPYYLFAESTPGEFYKRRLWEARHFADHNSAGQSFSGIMSQNAGNPAVSTSTRNNLAAGLQVLEARISSLAGDAVRFEFAELQPTADGKYILAYLVNGQPGQAVVMVGVAQKDVPQKNLLSLPTRYGSNFVLLSQKSGTPIPLKASTQPTQLQPLALPGAAVEAAVALGIGILALGVPVLSALAGAYLVWSLSKATWILGALIKQHGWAFLAHLAEPVGAYNPVLRAMVDPAHPDQVISKAGFFVTAHDQYAHAGAQTVSDFVLRPFGRSLAGYALAASEAKKQGQRAPLGYYIWNVGISEFLAHVLDLLSVPLVVADGLYPDSKTQNSVIRISAVATGTLVGAGIPVLAVLAVIGAIPAMGALAGVFGISLLALAMRWAFASDRVLAATQPAADFMDANRFMVILGVLNVAMLILAIIYPALRPVAGSAILAMVLPGLGTEAKVPKFATAQKKLEKDLSQGKHVSLALCQIDSFEEMKEVYGTEIASFIHEKTLQAVKRSLGKTPYLFRGRDDQSSGFGIGFSDPAGLWSNQRVENVLGQMQNDLQQEFNRKFRIVTLPGRGEDLRASRLEVLQGLVAKYGHGAVSITKDHSIQLAYEESAEASLQAELEASFFLERGNEQQKLGSLRFNYEDQLHSDYGYLYAPQLAMGVAGVGAFAQTLAKHAPAAVNASLSPEHSNLLFTDLDASAQAAKTEAVNIKGGIVITDELHSRPESIPPSSPGQLEPLVTMSLFKERYDEIFQRWFEARADAIAFGGHLDAVTRMENLRKLYETHQEMLDNMYEYDALGVIFQRARAVVNTVEPSHHSRGAVETRLGNITKLWEERHSGKQQADYRQKHPEYEPALAALEQILDRPRRGSELQVLRGVIDNSINAHGLKAVQHESRVKSAFSTFNNFIRYWNRAFAGQPDFTQANTYTQEAVHKITDDILGTMVEAPSLAEVEKLVNQLTPDLQQHGYQIKPEDGLLLTGKNVRITGTPGHYKIEQLGPGYFDVKIKLAPNQSLPFGAEIKILTNLFQEFSTRPDYAVAKSDLLKSKRWIVAMSGVSATNKHEAARLLADERGYKLVDIGLIYRAFGFAYDDLKKTQKDLTLEQFVKRVRIEEIARQPRDAQGLGGKDTVVVKFGRKTMTFTHLDADSRINVDTDAEVNQALVKTVTQAVLAQAKTGRVVVVGRNPVEMIQADVNLYFETMETSTDRISQVPPPMDATTISAAMQKDPEQTVKAIAQIISAAWMNSPAKVDRELPQSSKRRTERGAIRVEVLLGIGVIGIAAISALAWLAAGFMGVAIFLGIVAGFVGVVYIGARLYYAWQKSVAAEAKPAQVAEQAASTPNEVASLIQHDQELGVKPQAAAQRSNVIAVNFRASKTGQALQRATRTPASLRVLMLLGRPASGLRRSLILGGMIAVWMGIGVALLGSLNVETAVAAVAAGLATYAPARYAALRLQTNVDSRAGQLVLSSAWGQDNLAGEWTPAQLIAMEQDLVQILQQVGNNTESMRGVLQVLSELPGRQQTAVLRTQDHQVISCSLPVVILRNPRMAKKMLSIFERITVNGQEVTPIRRQPGGVENAA